MGIPETAVALRGVIDWKLLVRVSRVVEVRIWEDRMRKARNGLNWLYVERELIRFVGCGKAKEFSLSHRLARVLEVYKR